MTHKQALAAAAVIAGGLTVTACSSSAPPAATSPASAAAAASAASTPAQPETAAGAKAAAQQYFGLYSAGQYAAAWPLLAPTAQKAVPEATWAAVHQDCPSESAGLAYDVKNVTVTGSTAIATVTLAGAASSLASGSEAFTYAGGKWGYAPSPSDLSLYQHGSVAADVAAAKAQGYCAAS